MNFVSALASITFATVDTPVQAESAAPGQTQAGLGAQQPAMWANALRAPEGAKTIAPTRCSNCSWRQIQPICLLRPSPIQEENGHWWSRGGSNP